VLGSFCPISYRLDSILIQNRGFNLEPGDSVLAPELAVFDRYERRALSRRKVAVHAFDVVRRLSVAQGEQEKRVERTDAGSIEGRAALS
jgi:hypothetical protein